MLNSVTQFSQKKKKSIFIERKKAKGLLLTVVTLG